LFEEPLLHAQVLLKSCSMDERKFSCKVSDFGLSKVMNDASHLSQSTGGTLTHLAPETFASGSVKARISKVRALFFAAHSPTSCRSSGPVHLARGVQR
jgi:hypothetical protein